MPYTTQTGKVIYANNSVRSTTSGSIASTSSSGFSSDGTGFSSGGGGGGKIETTHESIEKITLDFFHGGETNLSFNGEQLFTTGHVATVVSRDNEYIAFFNQTTQRWYYFPPGLTRLQVLMAFLLFCLALYNVYWSFQLAGYGMYFATFPEIVTRFLFLLTPSVIGAGVFIIYRINFKREEKRKVREMIRDHEQLYETEIATSKKRHRENVEVL